VARRGSSWLLAGSGTARGGAAMGGGERSPECSGAAATELGELGQGHRTRELAMAKAAGALNGEGGVGTAALHGNRTGSSPARGAGHGGQRGMA
jgi:hypothetical protein